MMTVVLDLVPWWGWLLVAAPFAFLAWRWLGLHGALAVLIAGAAAALTARGYGAGVAREREFQRRADYRAREVILDRKEDVRSLPSTPQGAAERDRRFSRWEK